MARALLEREHELAALAAAAQDAAGGAGSVVLVFGEAGIGKSSLVEAVRAQLPAEGRLLVGYCDDLATSRTLGPFRDLVGSIGLELTKAVQDGDRDSVLNALRAELDRPEHPTVLVIEDVHWADDATLDVLRYLIRRIERLSAVLVLTYRDDELDRGHPLRPLLGLASGADGARRLALRRLSEAAVRELSTDRPDAGEVFSVTSGNPFFVSEILAEGVGDRVPPTIVDAVLARVRRLDPAAQDALEQLAVVPSTLHRRLVDALLPSRLEALAAAEQHGLLVVSPTSIAFRHELTRRAIVDSLPAARRMELNGRVLAVLVSGAESDLSRIVHHAAETGDQDVIARYGPDAARDAARAGARREAAAHYRLVLEQRDRFPPSVRAELLEAYAVESYTVGDSRRAVDAQTDAVALRRSLGDPGTLGAGLRWLSRMHWWNGDRTSAEAAAQEAIAVLEGAGDTRLLALALSNQSQLHMLADHPVESIELGERAAALAREVGDAAILSHALTNIGASMQRHGDPRGSSTLEAALQVALDAGEIEHACRAYVSIIWRQLDDFRLDAAGRNLDAAIDLAESAEYLGFLNYLYGTRARWNLARAAWGDAVHDAELGLGDQAPMRCVALTVLGRVRVRLGQPGADDLLDEAWHLAVGMNELQRTGPVAAARAEAAWLRGDPAAVLAIAEPAYEESLQLGYRQFAAELGYWLTRAGRSVPSPAIDHPYALMAAGRWQEAAAAWRSAGCPYDHAASLAESTDPKDLLAALAELDALGAEPLASVVRGRLREFGVTAVPRRPVATSRRNPAGLTERQVEVLRLLAKGHTNAEIAERLVVSVRTVDSHVAAVLDKLSARTRRDAAARAAELGIRLGQGR